MSQTNARGRAFFETTRVRSSPSDDMVTFQEDKQDGMAKGKAATSTEYSYM